MAAAGLVQLMGGTVEEVIETMFDVGNMLPSQICCTGLGGLSVTSTAKKIEKNLN